jgi:hypothetical protein
MATVSPFTAHDPAAPDFLQGGVLTNATAGQSMTIENLTIQGTGFTPVPGCGRGSLFGIHFNDASGTVDHVTVEGITEDSGCPSSTGVAIRADGITAARTVSITNTTVTGYQRSGLDARGSMTMNVSTGTVVGPPKDLNNVIAQNGVVYASTGSGQPGGTISDSTIFGSGDAIQNVSGTAILLSGANNVTLTSNTVTGDAAQKGTDVGIFVQAGSSAITISNNDISRSAPDVPDLAGLGVFVDDTSSATLICNTFSNWITNIEGAIQIACTPPPDGTVGTPYTAPTFDLDGGTAPFTWTITAGSLPPGLTLADDGTIAGTPTEAGTFDFTVSVADANGLTATFDTSITVAPLPATTTTTTTTTTTSTTTIPASTTTVPASTTTGSGEGTTISDATATSAPPPSGTSLPFTGSGTGPALFGIAVVLTGAVLVARNRRRR